MTRFFNFKSSVWAVAFIALALVSAGYLKARQADQLAPPIGANVISTEDANLW
jgi:hypothetical protein